MDKLFIITLTLAVAAADPIIGNPGPCAADPCSCCDSFGNVYRPIYSTNCNNFTQSYAGVTSKPKSCLPGLVFDINTCVCNYPAQSASCGCQQVAANAPEPFVAKQPAAKFSPNSIKINRCTCYEKGNYYNPSSANGCRSFFQRTAFLPAEEQNCPIGLVFDVNECVCNWPNRATCPAGCQGGPFPPVSSVSCRSHGNIYAPVRGTNCAQFTQATDVLPPVTHNCPADLQFDVSVCVCNWPRDTTCTV